MLSLLLVLSSFGFAAAATENRVLAMKASLVPEGQICLEISESITAANTREAANILSYDPLVIKNNETSEPIKISKIEYRAPVTEQGQTATFTIAADSTDFTTSSGHFSMVLKDGNVSNDFASASSYTSAGTIAAGAQKSYEIEGKVSAVESDVKDVSFGSLVVTVESVAPLPYLAIESMTAGESFKVNIAGVNTNNMQYSYDNSTWNDLEIKEYSVTGGRMYLRGSKTNSTATVSTYYGSNTDESCIKITDGSVRLSGNIMGLYNYSWVESNQSQDSVGSRWFANLFTNSTAIVDASELLLPAQEIGESSYAMMFYGCTNLKNAPALPMTSVKATSCNSMFYNCSSLEDIPLLYITAFNENYGLKNMFVGTGARLSATRSEVYKYEYRIPASGTAIESGSNNLHQMFSQENDEYFTPSLNTQYYVNLPTVAAS